MNIKMKWLLATTLILAGVVTLSTLLGRRTVQAQGASGFARAPRCTIGTASGTYGYHMEGQLVGVGPFMVNGIFTHHTDGTMDADVQSVIGNQSFPTPGTGGTFKINDDCTGTGMFRVD